VARARSPFQSLPVVQDARTEGGFVDEPARPGSVDRETRFAAGIGDGILADVLNGFVAACWSGEQASLDATRARTSARA
jgi:hypothetical protein